MPLTDFVHIFGRQQRVRHRTRRRSLCLIIFYLYCLHYAAIYIYIYIVVCLNIGICIYIVYDFFVYIGICCVILLFLHYFDSRSHHVSLPRVDLVEISLKDIFALTNLLCNDNCNIIQYNKECILYTVYSIELVKRCYS